MSLTHGFDSWTTYDPEVDALYVYLEDKGGIISRTLTVDEGINLDINEAGRIAGIEILNYHRKAR